MPDLDQQRTDSSLTGPFALLDDWRLRARVAQVGHFKTAVRLKARHWWLGVSMVALNAVAATAVFSTLTEPKNEIFVKILAGLISVTAVALAAIHSFDNAAERAEIHRSFAAQYGSLYRELELYIATGDKSDAAVKAFLAEFNPRWNALTAESPTQDESAHLAAMKQVEEERVRGSTVKNSPKAQN